jgi:hypothetical protein
LLQRLQKRTDAVSPFRIVLCQIHEHSNAPHPLALLRASGERRDRHRAAGKSYEIAPPQDHSHAGQGIIPIKSSTLEAGRMQIARRQGVCPGWVIRRHGGRPTYVSDLPTKADIGGSRANVRFRANTGTQAKADIGG